MAYYELNDFSGGVNTLISPDKIAPNEAVRIKNFKIESASLVSERKPKVVATGYRKNAFYYKTNDEIVSSDEDRFYVEWAGLLYWSNSAGTMKRYDGTTTLDVGNHVPPDTAVTLTDSTVAGFPDGTYSYVYTYIHSDMFESPPSPVASISVTGSQVDISFSDTPPTTATKRRLYRAGGLNPNYCLVEEIDIGTTAYRDNKADFEIVGNELGIFNNYPPPVNLDMLIENQGTFFGVIGNKIYWSFSGTPEYWNPYSYVELESDVTGLTEFGGYVIAFTDSAMYALYGLTDQEMTLKKLPYKYGCANKRSIQKLENLLIWYSVQDNKIAICAFDGGSVRELTRGDKFFGQEKISLNTYESVDGTYVSKEYIPKFSIANSNKYMLFSSMFATVIDFSIGGKIYYLDGVFEGGFVKGKDTIVIDSSGNAYDLFPDYSAYYDGEYVSGELTLGDNSTKEFRRVHIRSNKNVTANIYIDGQFVHSDDQSRFYLPAESIGKKIQIAIKGNGYTIIEAIGIEFEKVGI